MSRVVKIISALLPAAFVFAPSAALACATCYGASDAPMARGMNWGIFTLMGVIGTVLSGIAGVGFYFARRAAACDPASTPSTTQKL